MNSIYRDNMTKLMTRNHIAKIAHDNNMTMDEVVKRIRDNTDMMLKSWDAVAKQIKDER